MIYTMATQNGVILRSDLQGYFRLQDPGIVACGRCGAGVMTLLRTRHREVCKLEEVVDVEATTVPEQPTEEGVPQDPKHVAGDKVVEAAYPPDDPPKPPSHPLIVIPQLARLPKPPGGNR